MKVAIGAIAATRGGPATYAIELVRALTANFPEDRWTVLTDAPRYFEAFADTVEIPLNSAWGQPRWDHLGVRRALRRGDYDLYHGTKGVLPIAVGIPAVVTIHDLAVEVMPETFSRAQRLHLRIETPHTIRSASAVVTDSQSSRRDLDRLYPGSSEKLHVVPLAPGNDLAPATAAEVADWKTAHGLDGPVVGYLGTLQPRKNVDLLAESFRLAAGDGPWRLLLAGRMRPGYRPRCLDEGDERIAYLGEIPHEEVPLFLGALDCMVSPSSYEGFGLSFLEAMAAGCPVVGVANSSVPEVVGDAGILVGRPDAATLGDAIESVVTDISLASQLSQRGVDRAALFSWSSTARRTREIYESVLTRAGGAATAAPVSMETAEGGA